MIIAFNMLVPSAAPTHMPVVPVELALVFERNTRALHSPIYDLDLSAALSSFVAICAYRFRYELVPIGSILAVQKLSQCIAWRELCFCEMLAVVGDADAALF